jgi:hypothetical protein
LEEEAATSAKYIEDVTKRLLFLKKLDGFPVIRDLVLPAFPLKRVFPDRCYVFSSTRKIVDS